MRRLTVALVLAGIAAPLAAAQAVPAAPLRFGRAFVPTPATQAATADLVAVGTITAFEKEEVEVPQFANAAGKVSYRLAVVKVDENLFGAGDQTHVKVGCATSGPAARPGQAGALEWKENAAGLFIVTRHHTGSFSVCAYNAQPLDTSAESYKESREQVRQALAVVADPLKALKAKDAKDRHFAAGVLVHKYRTPASGSTVRGEALPADESKLILDALLDADWDAPGKGVPAPYTTFIRLGLSEKDKWRPAAFNGNGTQESHTKDEFRKWYAGDGAKYQVQKLAAK